VAAALIAVCVASGCVSQAEPEPAVIRTTAPPWDAPRDAISYIEAAGLEAEPLESRDNSHVLTLSIDVDGFAVPIPPYVGIDRLRSQRAAVHTHDSTGQVWLEGRSIDQITLGQFFTVWGVRYDEGCLGDACDVVEVTADGEPVTDGAALKLAEVTSVSITAR
jgi:hypothetical protein